jgi:hypothetical protein
VPKPRGPPDSAATHSARLGRSAALWLTRSCNRCSGTSPLGRFVRIDDQSGGSVGNVIYARSFGASGGLKRPAFSLGHDNDELVLADLIDETPVLAPVLLPVGWFQATPKIRALEFERPDQLGSAALSREPGPRLAGMIESAFILDAEVAAELHRDATSRGTREARERLAE